jgi:hypothetical protein
MSAGCTFVHTQNNSSFSVIFNCLKLKWVLRGVKAWTGFMRHSAAYESKVFWNCEQPFWKSAETFSAICGRSCIIYASISVQYKMLFFPSIHTHRHIFYTLSLFCRRCFGFLPVVHYTCAVAFVCCVCVCTMFCWWFCIVFNEAKKHSNVGVIYRPDDGWVQSKHVVQQEYFRTVQKLGEKCNSDGGLNTKKKDIPRCCTTVWYFELCYQMKRFYNNTVIERSTVN